MERKKKNKVVMFFLFLLFVSCNGSSKIEAYKVSPALYEFDKRTIAEAYLNNIEYYRLYYPYELELRQGKSSDSVAERLIAEQLERHYQKYPKVKDEPSNFYWPYAYRTLPSMDRVRSPIPTKEQVYVSVDSIIYNKNATLCIVFLCVEDKYDDIEGLEDEEHTFTAQAMVGYRKHPKDTLRTYPMTFFSLMGYDFKGSLVDDLIKLYTTRLKGTYLTGSVYEGYWFKHNVGEKGFFTESPLFMKYNDSTYYFQMYRALGKDYRYDYPY